MQRNSAGGRPSWRVVARSGNTANANNGLVNVNANNDAATSNSNYGARLTNKIQGCNSNN